MKHKLVVFIFLLTALQAKAEPWTTEQKAVAAVGAAALVVDYGQTRWVTQRCNGCYERNPLLGRHPHQDKVAGYFLLVPVVTYLVADHLKSDTRTKFLYVTAGLQLAVVGRNVQFGYKTSF